MQARVRKKKKKGLHGSLKQLRCSYAARVKKKKKKKGLHGSLKQLRACAEKRRGRLQLFELFALHNQECQAYLHTGS
jgi:hypothetical protein